MTRPVRSRFLLRPCTLTSIALLLLAGCLSPYGRPGEEMPRRGDEIVVCGHLFHTGTRVVLWTDTGGFDAYRVHRRFSNTDQMLPSDPVEGANTPNRYSPVRKSPWNDMQQLVGERGWRLDDLQRIVDQFVIHYDAAGTSRKCFEVLHDVRGLSVHFMLDVDGTIYQTLDLKERARHATVANDRSVGIEIASMGAYSDPEELKKYYHTDPDGRVRLILPPDWRPFGANPFEKVPAFRPARNRMMKGRINHTLLYQYDFTNEQYAALIRLTATLHQVFPKLPVCVPSVSAFEQELHEQRDATRAALGPLSKIMYEPGYRAAHAGAVATGVFARGKRPTTGVLSTSDLNRYRGLLGHYHVQSNKYDPGPAFDWERVLHETWKLR